MLKQLKSRAKLKELIAKLEDLNNKRNAFKTRSAELNTALEEAQNEEDLEVVNGEIAELEKEMGESDLDAEAARIEQEISDIEDELRAISEKGAEVVKPEEKRTNRLGGKKEMRRTKFFNMNAEERDAFFNIEEVRSFIGRIKDNTLEQRAVSGADLTIPEEILSLLRENMNKYSKLITKVNLKPVSGKARQNVTGTIPEGVWTEAVGALNEIDLSIGAVELDGFKVGGFVPLSNTYIEDASEESLGQEVITMLGQSIGLGIDKAILYGTGKKMPLGIATRLAQTEAPDNGDSVPWNDLHTSNIRKLDIGAKTGIDFFTPLFEALGVASPDYAAVGDAPIWCCNHKTAISIKTKALAFNSAAALMSGINTEMPVLGGEIIELPFIADDEIIGGYGSTYILVERAGSQFKVADQVRAIEDQTVYIGTARYDGKPAVAEGFVIANFANTKPKTSAKFEADLANEEPAQLVVTSVAGSAAGHTTISVNGDDSAASKMYIVADAAKDVAAGYKPTKSWKEYTTDVVAGTGKVITVVGLNASGRVIAVGSATVTAHA